MAISIPTTEAAIRRRRGERIRRVFRYLSDTRDFWLIIALSLVVFFGVFELSPPSINSRSIIRWDAAWHQSIVELGYVTDGNQEIEHNTAFSPLFPLVCRLILPLGIGAGRAMVLVSVLSSVTGFYVIYILIRRQYPRHIVRSTLALLAFNPFTLFLYNGYSEGLFLLLIALFFYFLDMRRMSWAAAVCVGLASATRTYGCLLAVVFVLELLRRQYETGGLRKATVHLKEVLLWTPVCFIGLIAQTIYFGYVFQDPLIFSHSYFAWGTTPGQSISWSKLLAFGNIMESISFVASSRSLPFAAGVMVFLAAPVVTAVAWRKVQPSFAIFVLLMFGFFQLIGHQSVTQMIGTGRHMVVIFPVALLTVISLQREQITRVATLLVDPEGMTGEDSIAWRVLCATPLYFLILTSLFLYALFIYRYFRGVFIS